MKENTSGRLLLTWNTKKHPEVVEFFDNIEEGFYSHSVREAIKFYMKHHNEHDNSPVTSNRGSQGNEKEIDVSEVQEANKPRKSVESDYDNFDPHSL